jgi:lipopolysaccharide export system protein LptC
MNKAYNVLIIDDHPTIIEGFQNTLKYMQEQSETLSFNTEGATDCETAYQKIQSYSDTKPLDLVILAYQQHHTLSCNQVTIWVC